MLSETLPPWNRAIRQEIRSGKDALIQLRRDLHQHPELGFEEVRTSTMIAERLESWGLPTRRNVAKTGVVALIEGALPGPTLLLRADMDALPIQEETGLPYASQTHGRMHACGHDGHTAILLTTAGLLASQRAQLRGCVKVVFQPAEEGPGGALRMIEEGVLDAPKVDVALGLHLWSPLPLGQIAVSPGPVMAAADHFSVKIIGKGGHAGAPEACIDSVLIAAHIVTALNSLRGRYVDPFEPAVLSVTRIQAGNADNVIPGEADLGGTVRTVRPETRELLRIRMRELVFGIAKGFGAHAQFEYLEGYPPLSNDERITRIVTEVCSKVVGLPSGMMPQRTMGGEDMAYFLREVPGCYFFLGAGNDATGCGYAHHHPRFNLDEEALLLGVELFLRIVTKFGDLHSQED